MPARNFTDELWQLLPKYSSTTLEKNVLTLAPFDYFLDPAIKVLRRAKGDWLGWHTLTDSRGRLILDGSGKPQVIHDANFWIVDGDGDLIVDENGEEIVAEPDYSRRFLVVGDSSYLYWLAVEYGVNYLAEVLPDIGDRIAGGVELNRIAGTPAAVKLVLRWLNFPDAEVIEETEPTVHFPEYQVELGRFPTDVEIRKLVRALHFAAPERSRLRRLVHGCNTGRFIMSDSDWGDVLSDYSGWRIDQLTDDKQQLKASFCDVHGIDVAPESIVWDITHTTEIV